MFSQFPDLRNYTLTSCKWDKAKEEPRWSEDRRTSFGIITISIQRMTNDGHNIAYQWDKIAFEPLLKIGSDALIARGTEQTIWHDCRFIEPMSSC